jgi:hypothetical protein
VAAGYVSAIMPPTAAPVALGSTVVMEYEAATCRIVYFGCSIMTNNYT